MLFLLSSMNEIIVFFYFYYYDEGGKRVGDNIHHLHYYCSHTLQQSVLFQQLLTLSSRKLKKQFISSCPREEQKTTETRA